MADPRIKRTRAHVFSVVQEMIDAQDGTAITMASLAASARVSRRTLSTHWDSMDDLLTESLAAVRTLEFDDVSLPVEVRLRSFLHRARDNIQTPINFTVFLTVLASEKSKQEPSPDAGVYAFARDSLAEFREKIALLSSDQYATLVGPIVFQELFTATPASDELIEDLLKLGLAMIAELPSSKR